MSIVEMRTYLLRPGSVKDVEDLFRDHLHHRTPLSPMGGLWHTLTGQLNTIVHLWPYDSIQERFEIRAEMMQPPKWPPPRREYLREMQAPILLPAAFSPPLVSASHGGLYEFCIDSYLPGGVAECQEAWAQKIEARTAISPMVFCGLSEFGALNQWVHIWAYRDAAHRDKVHERLMRESIWPPEGGKDRLFRQDSFLAEPAQCSPLN